jgi:hypothetical protein
MTTIKLGDDVKDTITGLNGVAVSKIEYKNGCRQFGVQQKILKDGEIPEIEYIDPEDLEVITKAKKKPAEKTPAGPSRFSPGSPLRRS